MSTYGGRIPVSLITGFLGSGKTTVLNHLVGHPGMGRVAVIVNEFGEIGLDHELIEKSDENTILLGSGCLCCTVRGDLVDTLGDLAIRRLKGTVPPFQRVVIETTGLADPAPILHTLMSVPVVGRYRLDTVITTVDAVNGRKSLDEYEEAVKQVAMADRLLVTKSDLCDQQEADLLTARLRELNPAALATPVTNGVVEPADLFGSSGFDVDAGIEAVRDWLKADCYDNVPAHAKRPERESDSRVHMHGAAHHLDRIQAFCLTFDEPLDWQTTALWLDSLVAHQGEKLLRVKGLIDVRGVQEPMVIHAVQHLFHPPARLKAWPQGRRQSRMVFITRDLTKADVETALVKAEKLIRAQVTHPGKSPDPDNFKREERRWSTPL